MPIQFPQPKRGNQFDRWKWQRGAKSPQPQVAPNLARPGFPFTAAALAPGFWHPATVRPNLRNLGRMYRHGNQSRAVVNPAGPLAPAGSPAQLHGGDGTVRPSARTLSSVRNQFAGLTLDANGLPLGTCEVMLFTTATRILVTETASDINGSWSVMVTAGWPSFVVAYKDNVPDVAGSSLNTLVPEHV